MWLLNKKRTLIFLGFMLAVCLAVYIVGHGLLYVNKDPSKTCGISHKCGINVK